MDGDATAIIGRDDERSSIQRALDGPRPIALIERAQSSPVGLASALLGQRIGRLEQPKGGADAVRASAHSEQATHRKTDGTG